MHQTSISPLQFNTRVNSFHMKINALQISCNANMKFCVFVSDASHWPVQCFSECVVLEPVGSGYLLYSLCMCLDDYLRVNMIYHYCEHMKCSLTVRVLQLSGALCSTQTSSFKMRNTGTRPQEHLSLILSANALLFV